MLLNFLGGYRIGNLARGARAMVGHLRATQLRGDGVRCRVHSHVAAGLDDAIWRINAVGNAYPNWVRFSHTG